MKIVIYRSKEDNKIVNFHELRDGITQKIVDNYNNTDPNRFAEIIELDEIGEYFYTLKTRQIVDEMESLENIESDLRDLASTIEDKLYEMRRYIILEGKNDED